MRTTYDFVHYYRGYWSDEGKCRIRIHQDGRAPVATCSQLPDNDNTSVTNLAEHLAEVIEEHVLQLRLSWVHNRRSTKERSG
jgi:hypothetical protein